MEILSPYWNTDGQADVESTQDVLIYSPKYPKLKFKTVNIAYSKFASSDTI